MKIDALFHAPIKKAAKAAQEAEFLGYNGVWVTETAHNPFFPMIPIATHTQKLQMGSGIAVALARSPMTLAQEAWDLAELSHGRFILGLGSQVQAHIVRRFGMPWDKPVDQMRDMMAALRAIWYAFQHRTPLKYEGPYQKLSLLTPFFSPHPMEHWEIPIYIAAVGPHMTSLGAEVANGLMLHAFTNVPYLKKATLPAIEAGLRKAGRTRSDLTVGGPVFVITGNDEEALKMEAGVRQQIAFYGSTPAYSEVLGVLGQGDLAKELHRMSRQQQWDDMARLIPAEVVDAFAVRAPLDRLATALLERYSGYLDRVVMYLPLPAADATAVQACLSAVQMSPVAQMDAVTTEYGGGIAPPPELMAPPLRAGRGAEDALPTPAPLSIADAPAVYSHVPPPKPRRRKLVVTPLHFALAAASGLALTLGLGALFLVVWMILYPPPDTTMLADLSDSAPGDRVTLGQLDVTKVSNMNPYGSSAQLVVLEDARGNHVTLLNTSRVPLALSEDVYGLSARVTKVGDDIVLVDPFRPYGWWARADWIPPVVAGLFFLLASSASYYILHRGGVGFIGRRR